MATAGPDVPASAPATERAQNRFIDSVRKSAFIIGSSLIVFTAARNSITWHLQRFWGASGDFWARLWHYVYHDLSGSDDYVVTVYGTMYFTTAVFWLFNSLLMLMYATGRPKWAEKYKVQQDVPTQVEPRRLVKAVLVCLFNQFVMGYLLGVVGYFIMVQRGCPFETADLPTFQWVVWEVFIFTLLEEAFFYYTHRLLHHPFFYKRVHKLHHEWTAPISIIGLYCHPFEYVLSNALPLMVGPMVMGSHMATTWLWYAIALLSTSVAHCGFHLPFFPSPEAHDFHHLKFTNCFGVLGVLDRLHGTDRAFRASKAYDRHFMMLSLVPVRDLFPDTKGKNK